MDATHEHHLWTSTTTTPIDIPSPNPRGKASHAVPHVDSTNLLKRGPRPTFLPASDLRVDTSNTFSSGSPQPLGFSPLAAMAMVQNSFVSPASPAASPPDELQLEYQMLMYKADQHSGHAPGMTPPHRPPEGPRSPCGCASYNPIDNGFGEMVCMECGVCCGRVHVRKSRGQ